VKFIKSYKVFESVKNNIFEDIKDILIELEDDGSIGTTINVRENRKYIGFFLKDHLNYDGFLFSEISDYVFRLKDYLGENFKSCSVLLVRDKNRYGVGGYRVNINLDDENKIIKLKDLPIENLVIDIK
jgi:hypothetical protein